MDKLIGVLTNKWLKFGVSVLSLVYPVFIGFVVWLMMGYYFEPTHEGALFTLYIFINVIFGGIMLFTRKQAITKICAMIVPLISFAVLILGFGNWFVVIPPVAVCVLVFFISGVGETAKTVIGTMYLILYVVGVLVYLTLTMLFGKISFVGVDLSIRSTTYRYSPDEQYRIVTYAEPESDRMRTVSFHLEETDGDISLPFLECRNAKNSLHLITSRYNTPAILEWKGEHTLYIDGRQREFSFETETEKVPQTSSDTASSDGEQSQTDSSAGAESLVSQEQAEE